MTSRIIHALSPQSKGPFIVLNAATITPEHMEIELGDIENGALEEAQVVFYILMKLLTCPLKHKIRVLKDQIFQRVGRSKKIKVDVRVISSTSQNLEILISNGRF